MTALDLAEQWFVGQPTLRLILGLLFLGIFTFIFVRLTGGTGWTLWFIGVAGLVFLFVRWPLSLLVAFLPLLVVLYLVERGRRGRKLPYLPPIAQVEGGGIKRGRTAPEAAALLEMPLNKVLTLLIFGLLKKGVLRQTGEEPFQVEVIPEFQAVHGKANLEQRQQTRKRAPPSKPALCCTPTSSVFWNALRSQARRRRCTRSTSARPWTGSWPAWPGA